MPVNGARAAGPPRPAAEAFVDAVPLWRRAVRYHVVRLGLALLVRCYLRLPPRVGLAGLPVPSVLCFNHLSWVDPMVLYAVWPNRPRLAIYGPKEADLSRGLRNRLIAWSGVGVPFAPGKRNLLSSTKRGVAVLREGRVLAVAPEGRLSEAEDVVEPLNGGAVFLAVRAGVPLVPVAINGTRWLRFGKRVRLRLGEPIPTTGLRADRETLARLTAELHAQLGLLVQGYPDTAIPGPFGRWLTDLFNERPWLLEAEGADPPASLPPVR